MDFSIFSTKVCEKEEGSHYPCMENKCADQLSSYCAAYLRLCFCICKKPVFS